MRGTKPTSLDTTIFLLQPFQLPLILLESMVTMGTITCRPPTSPTSPESIPSHHFFAPHGAGLPALRGCHDLRGGGGSGLHEAFPPLGGHVETGIVERRSFGRPVDGMWRILMWL